MEQLNDFRATHKVLAEKQGLNEKVLDSYKFTPLKKFFEELNYTGERQEIQEQKTSFPTITYCDGVFTLEGELPQGIEVRPIKDYMNELKDLISEEHTLSHLHHSHFGEGLFIKVAKDAVIKTPVRLLNKLTDSKLSTPTHLIVAEKHSKVSFIEETIGSELPHTLLTETYIKASPGADVEHIFLDQESSLGLNHGTIHGEISKDSTIRSFIFHNSGKLNRKNLVLRLNEPGANGESYALFLTNEEEHSDVYTLIDHRAADTTSAQMAKGILDGNSKGVFTGKIFIRPDAQRVSSSQLNKNLLLSKKAQVHSQPQLEIFADDVKCSHGSTTGQLSDDEVFYFSARGIPSEKARTLLALGFGLEIVQKITNEEARNYLHEKVLKTLESKFDLGEKK